MEYQQPPSTYSKKLSNASPVGGINGKLAYDGVFGVPAAAKSTRMEDYREIFSGSSKCSIPILDFPDMNERKSSSNGGSSLKPDYSMIFGGFGEADYAVPYEELVQKVSSKESRTTTERSQNFSTSAEQVKLPEEGPQVFDNVKQYNVLYNKSHQGSKNGVNGMATHVAQLDSVPGYARVIDETTAPSPVIESVKPVRTVLNDAHLNVNVGESLKPPKYLRKVVSGPQPRGVPASNSSSHVESQKRSGRTMSFSNDISFDAFEMGLGTQQKSTSPLRGISKGASMSSMSSKYGFCRSDASEGTAGSYSPPHLDEELDANSAAAASAAAMRKAIKEAEAKMKLAKELMEKKKQGLFKSAKPCSNDSLKAERKEHKAAEETKDTQEMYQEVYDVPKQVFSGLSETNATKESHGTPDLRNEEKSSAVKNDVEKIQSMEYKWAQAKRRREADTREATIRFSEPTVAVDNSTTGLEVKQATNMEKMQPCADEKECKEKVTGVDSTKNSAECDRKPKAFDEAPMQEKVERVLNSVAAAFKWDIFRSIIKSNEDTQRQEENVDKTRVASQHVEAHQTPVVPYEQQSEIIATRLHEPEKEAKCETQETVESKDLNILQSDEDGVQIEIRETEARALEEGAPEEVENQAEIVPFRKENDSGIKLHEIDTHEENEKRQKEDLVRIEDEKQQEHWVYKENAIVEPDDTVTLDQSHHQEVTGAAFCDLQEKEECENRPEEYCETEGNEDLEHVKENEEILNQINGKGMEETCEWVEAGRTQTGIHLMESDDNNMEANQQCFRCQDNLEPSKVVCHADENDNAGSDDEIHGDMKSKGMEVISEVADSLTSETGEEAKSVEEAHNLGEEGNLEAGVSDTIGLDEIKKQTSDFYLSKNVMKFDHKLYEYHMTECMKACEQELNTEEVTSRSDDSNKGAGKSESEIGLEENESKSASSFGETWSVDGAESKTLCGPEKHVEDTVGEPGENNRDLKEPEVVNNHEDEISSESSCDEIWMNYRIVGQASQHSCTFEGEGKERMSVEERVKQSTDKKEEGQYGAQKVEERDAQDTSHKVIGLEKNHHEVKKETRVRNSQGISQKETEFEKEHSGVEDIQRTKDTPDTLQKKMEVERKKCGVKEEIRMMEKERLAVERAIREARERAFAEAREKAERAAAEAHQRKMAEARERLEKACAEANGKSAAEKESMEAKLKAERAAVERATAEARERALQRALSEKATFKARNQAEKFSGVSRDAGVKSTDQQYKGPAPSSSSKHTNSSNHDGSYPTERFNAANGETVERCKATLERNQRTAERAAKALAEKNMRDLLAQKEQAERNRLAEILDANVKRWSSGKERNLRALLSTLQYILGADSGWQPIPLTELITSAAVKKAYRKATLFVHPDKLQQRGASIQQKYTCEKVFDLLKDAWNKFSSEER